MQVKAAGNVKRGVVTGRVELLPSSAITDRRQSSVVRRLSSDLWDLTLISRLPPCAPPFPPPLARIILSMRRTAVIITLAAACHARVAKFCHTEAGGPLCPGPPLEAPVSLRWRLALALVGLTLLVLAAATAAYRRWPLGTEQDDFRPAPTLFAPPAGHAPDEARP
jgi:hypothetical protein